MIPPSYEIRGSTISTRWLSQQFSTPPIEADDVTLERFAQAFILALLGSALFANQRGMHVQLYFLPLLRDFTETFMYSWGSAVLAHLYRELFRASWDNVTDIVRCKALLQVLLIFFRHTHCSKHLLLV